MANENLPPEKQRELQEGGIMGDVNKLVDWIASLIEDSGGDPENPKDIANFMANPNPHAQAGFGIEQGATTHPAPENPNPFTQAGTFIGNPMHEATGNYTRGGEFRLSPSPNEAFGGGGTTSASVSPTPERNVNPGSGEKPNEKERVVAPTGTQPTPNKKEETPKAGTDETGGSGGGESSSQTSEQEVEALRGLANLVLGGGGPPQPGIPSGGLGSAPRLGSAVGGVGTPQQSLNPFGNFRRF